MATKSVRRWCGATRTATRATERFQGRQASSGNIGGEEEGEAMDTLEIDIYE